MSDFSEILYRVEDRIAVITFNRPEKLNAWTAVMEDEVRAALGQAARDSGVRAIVLTGAGRGFCAGADLSPANTPRLPPPDGTGDFDQRYSYLLDIGKPIIAAINGPIAGVGLCIALFCDLRFVAAGAKLTTAFAKRGLIAEHGSAWMLPRLVGPMYALDLLLSGRTFEAEEADRIGLARRVPAEGFLNAVMAYARDLAVTCSPRSLQVIKRQVNEALHQRLGEAIRLSNAEQRASLESVDLQEGIAAFRERRAPDFPPLTGDPS